MPDSITPEILPPEKPQKQRTAAQNSGKKPGTLSRKTKTALNLAINHGVDPKTAITLASGGITPSATAVSNFKAKVAKYSLQAPGMQKLASNVVKDVLKGKVVTYSTQKAVAGVGIVDMEITERPTFTNQLAAAAMVMDRVEPIVKHNINVNANLDFLPFSLESLK